MDKNVINPLGLKGKEQLQHIQDLMSKLSPVNEAVRNSVVELTKKAADGRIYAIVRENHNYFIKIASQKKGPLVIEDFQYIGGLQNKMDEVYPTYAKALKRLNGKLIVVAESYGSMGEINTFANEHLLNMEQENPIQEEEIEEEVDATVTEVVDELENDADIDYDDEKDYQTESRTGSIARALNEDDDNGYCNFNVLPKGIENFFNSIDDIKKKK